MNGIFDALIIVLELYRFILLAVVLLSWVNPDPSNPIVRFLRTVTDPVLLPFRRLLMPLTRQIRIDFSPILAFLLIGMLQGMLRRIQYGGLSAEGLAWAIVDGAVVFFAAVAMFLLVFLVARTVLEATQADRWNPIVRFVFMVTDPIIFRLGQKRLDTRVGRARFDARPLLAAGMLLAVYLLLQNLRTIIP